MFSSQPTRASIAPQPGKPVTSSCFCVCCAGGGGGGAGVATTGEPQVGGFAMKKSTIWIWTSSRSFEKKETCQGLENKLGWILFCWLALLKSAAVWCAGQMYGKTIAATHLKLNINHHQSEFVRFQLRVSRCFRPLKNVSGSALEWHQPPKLIGSWHAHMHGWCQLAPGRQSCGTHTDGHLELWPWSNLWEMPGSKIQKNFKIIESHKLQGSQVDKSVKSIRLQYKMLQDVTRC